MAYLSIKISKRWSFVLMLSWLKFLAEVKILKILMTSWVFMYWFRQSFFLFLQTFCSVVIFDVNQIMWRHVPHVHDIIRDRAHKYMVIIMSRRSMNDNILSKAMPQQFYKCLHGWNDSVILYLGKQVIFT